MSINLSPQRLFNRKPHAWAHGWKTWLLASAVLGGSIFTYVMWVVSRQDFSKCLCGLLKRANVTNTNPLGQSHIDLWAVGRLAKAYVPAGGVKPGMGAVFVLHGSFDSPQGMYGLGFEPLADERGFLIVYPTMSDPQRRSWAYADDLTYMAELVEKMKKDYEIDPERVFACGHSAGGTMSLFLQNEVQYFAAVGAVEAGVGRMDQWHMDNRGKRTMVIWNHGDPVLANYGGEQLYRSTIQTLRRRGAQEPYSRDPLPTNTRIVQAEMQKYADDAAPAVHMLSFRSEPGTHNWPRGPNCTFDGAKELVTFFFDWPA